MPRHSVVPTPEILRDWATGDYPRGGRRGPALLVLTGILFGLCLITVFGRLGVRTVRKSVGHDDALMLMAMILCTIMDVGIYFLFLKNGFDRHAWDLTERMAVSARKTALAVEALNLGSASFTKISILYFCKRLAGGTWKTSKYTFIICASIFFVAASLTSFLVTLFLTCYPLKAFWLRFSPAWESQNTYACLDEFAHLVSATSVSVAEDFIAFGVPAALIWRLQLGKRKRIALACLLGLGFLPCIAGVLRIAYTVRIYNGYDATWQAYPAYLCLVVETHLGILCASAPALNSSATTLVRRLRANSDWSVLRYNWHAWRTRRRDRTGSVTALCNLASVLKNRGVRNPESDVPPTPPPKDTKPPTTFTSTSTFGVLPGKAELEAAAYFYGSPRRSVTNTLLSSQTTISGGAGAEVQETRPFVCVLRAVQAV